MFKNKGPANKELAGPLFSYIPVRYRYYFIYSESPLIWQSFRGDL